MSPNLNRDTTAVALRGLLPQYARRLALVLPKPVVDAYENWKNPPPVTATPRPSDTDVALALADAAARGVDPSDDPEVQRLLNARQLADLDLPAMAHLAAETAYDDTVIDNAEDIANAIADAIDRDGAVLADAHQLLGNLDLDDARLADRLTDDQAAARVRARSARDRVQQLRKLHRLVAERARLMPSANPHRQVLELGPATLNQVRSLPPKPDAWQAVTVGMEISMVRSDAEWQQRSAALDDEIAAEEASAPP